MWKTTVRNRKQHFLSFTYFCFIFSLVEMKKANILTTLWAGIALSSSGLSHAQTSQDLYTDLYAQNAQKSSKEISLWEVKSSLTTLSSALSWTVINALDYGLPYNGFNSLYFDPTDSTRVLGAVWWMTVKDTTVHAYGYGGENTCFPFLSNGFSSYKDGDTLYWWTQDWLVKQSPAGCSVNTNVLISPNSKIMGIEKHQWYTYIATSLDGLCVLDANNVIVQRYTSTNSILPTNILTNIHKDNQWNLWISTGLGIVKLTGSVFTVYTSATTWLPFSSGLTDVVPDNNGNVWCWNTKLFCFSWWVRSEITVPTLATWSLQIKWIEVNQYGEVVLATKNNGVRIYNPSTWVWRVYDTSNSPLTTNRVNDVAVDTTAQDKIRVGIGSDASGFILLEESTAAYLPQLPSGISIVGEDSIQTGNTYTYHLSASVLQATEYQWSYSGSNVTLTPTDSVVQLHFGSNATLGTLSCRIRNNYTKPINDTLILNFDIQSNTVGIANNDFDDKYKVYPNPVTDNISIFPFDNFKSSDEYSCYIYNSTFKLLITSNKQCIDVSNLPNGMYFLRLTNKKGKSSYVKFIKE